MACNSTWKRSYHCSMLCFKVTTTENPQCHSTKKLIDTVDSLQVCAGHPDQKLLDMAMSRKGKFESYDGRTVAFVDEYFPVVLG